MRTDRKFVQAALIAWAPILEWDMERTIRFAERAWCVLSERGYGPLTAETPRAHIDWYAQLPADQRALFDQFWAAFARRGDSRAKAAMAWGKIAPSADLARAIICAAGQEAALPRRPDEVRKMAQGWLSERRWESYAVPSSEPTDTRGSRLRELRAELQTLRLLARGSANGDTFGAQIAKIEDEITALCPPTTSLNRPSG